MAAIETQQLRMLEQLRQAGRQPMTLDQLRAGATAGAANSRDSHPGAQRRRTVQD